MNNAFFAREVTVNLKLTIVIFLVIGVFPQQVEHSSSAQLVLYSRRQPARHHLYPPPPTISITAASGAHIRRRGVCVRKSLLI